MQQAFLQASQMKVTKRATQATINAASHRNLSSTKMIGELIRKENYRVSLCGRFSVSILSSSL